MGLGKSIGLLTLIASLYIVWQIRNILLLLFTAVILSIALNRLVRRLQKSRIDRSMAIAITLSICFAILGIFLAAIIVPLTEQFEQLPNLTSLSIGQLRDWSEQLRELIPRSMLQKLPDLTDLSIQIQAAANWIIEHVYLFFTNILTLLLNLLLIVVLTIMLLVNPRPYRNLLIKIFPAFYRKRLNEILCICESQLFHYVLGVALSMTFIGITSIVGLTVLQVPLPLVNGLLAGLSAFIPYIGAIGSAIPPTLLAFLDSPWKALQVVILYTFIQQVEGNFVTPIIMKQQVSLLPATTLALLTAFGTFFGFLGLFLGLPILVIAQTFINEILVKDICDRWKTPSMMT